MRPLAAVVQRSRSGQPWQCRSKTALLAAVRVTVCPAGQVAVRASMVDVEVVAAEPAGVGGRPRLDRQTVAASTQRRRVGPEP